jgi:NADH-quinone oxidoreductase subunit L
MTAGVVPVAGVVPAYGVLVSFAAAVLALWLGRRAPRVVAPLGVLGAGLGFLASAALVAGDVLGRLGQDTVVLAYVPTGALGFDVAFRIDGLTAMVCLLVTSVSLAVQVYSVGYLRGDPRYPSYVSLVSLFTAAMLLVVTADDLMVLLVGWEVMGICSYFLIGHHWELAEARDGAVKAFLVTRLGDVGFLFGIFVLGTAAGTFRISGIQGIAADHGLSTGTATLATLLLLCGIVGKSAQFPLHIWLPDAMAGPTPVSALIHAATMVAAGVFLLARLLALFELAPLTLAVLAVVAAVGMVGAALAALADDDLKRVLAWSTVSQLATMLAGLAVGGYAAGLLLLVTHGAFKALLFLCAGVLIQAVGSNLMSSMGGLRRARPVTFVTMTIGLAALAALPPLSGFFAKDAVLGAIRAATTTGGPLVGWAAWTLLAAAFVTLGLTAAYCTRVWVRVFFGPAATRVPAGPTPPSMRWPLVVLAVPSALVGLVALIPADWTDWLGGGGAAAAVGVAETAGAAVGELSMLHVRLAAVSVLVTVATSVTVVLAWLLLGRRDPAVLLGPLRPLLALGFRFDSLVRAAVVRPVWALARTTVATDRDVVDFYVLGSGRTARLLGGALRRLQAGNVSAYLSLLVAGVVVLAVAAGIRS